MKKHKKTACNNADSRRYESWDPNPKLFRFQDVNLDGVGDVDDDEGIAEVENDDIEVYQTAEVKNKGDRTFEFILHKDVPQFSSALASLITESDETRTRLYLKILGLPASHMQQSALADALSTRVRRALIDRRERNDSKKKHKSQKNTGICLPLPFQRDYPDPRNAQDEQNECIVEAGNFQDETHPYEMTCEELKRILRSRGLKVSGKKDELLSRVVESENKKHESKLNLSKSRSKVVDPKSWISQNKKSTDGNNATFNQADEMSSILTTADSPWH